MAPTGWRDLPPELRASVGGFLPLSDLDALQNAAPDASISALFATRVARLRPLFDVWVSAPSPRLPSYRNAAGFRTPSERSAASPVDFSRLRRVALGKVGTALAPALPALDELRSLAVLDVSGNALSSLPPQLVACTGLRVLNAGDNALADFPDLVLRLPQLHTLLLYGNPIARLPDAWNGAPAIRRLGLYNCALSGRVPSELAELLMRTARDSGRPRTANLSQNAFSADEVAELFTRYPSLQNRVAI